MASLRDLKISLVQELKKSFRKKSDILLESYFISICQNKEKLHFFIISKAKDK